VLYVHAGAYHVSHLKVPPGTGVFHMARRVAVLSRHLCATAAREHAAPKMVVGIIDMENRDGTIYSGDEVGLTERDTLRGVAEVIYTGARRVEDVSPEQLQRFDAVMLRRCTFGKEQVGL
jgi:hypothetical protein